MNYSPDRFVDCDPEETTEPLMEIPKTKSTQRKTIAAVCGFMELKKAKSTLYLEGFRLQQVKSTRVPERCVPRLRRAIHDWEMMFSRAERCPVAFGFVTACRRVLECPRNGV